MNIETVVLLGVVLILFRAWYRIRSLLSDLEYHKKKLQEQHELESRLTYCADQIIDRLFQQLHVPKLNSPDRVIEWIFAVTPGSGRMVKGFLSALRCRLRDSQFEKSALSQAVTRADDGNQV